MPSEATSFIAASSCRFVSASVAAGMCFSTSSWAVSTSTPVGWPEASFTIWPPCGSGVAAVMPATFSAARVHPARVAVDAAHDRRTIADDGIELARSREAALLPQHLVPAAADDPARVRIRGHVFADATQCVVDARRVAQVGLQLQLAEAEHVAVRVGEAGQHVLAAAVDDGGAGSLCVVSHRRRSAGLDAPVLDDDAVELLQALSAAPA